MKKIISNLAGTLNLSEKNTSNIIDATISVIRQRLLLGETILVNDIALFETDKKPEQILIYPDKMIKILIPPQLYPKVTLLKNKNNFPDNRGTYTRDLKTLITIQANLDEQFAQLFLDSLIKEISVSLQNNKTCKLTRLGSFINKAKQKNSFNTNAETSYDRNSVIFLPEKSFQNEINKAFAFFEPTIVEIKKLPEKKHSPKEILKNLEKIVETIQTYPKNTDVIEKEIPSVDNTQNTDNGENNIENNLDQKTVTEPSIETINEHSEPKQPETRNISDEKPSKDKIKNKISDILAEAVSIESSDLNYSREFYNIDITYNLDSLSKRPDIEEKKPEEVIETNNLPENDPTIDQDNSENINDDVKEGSSTPADSLVIENSGSELTLPEPKIIENTENIKEIPVNRDENIPVEKADQAKQEDFSNINTFENSIDVDAIMSVVTRSETSLLEEEQLQTPYKNEEVVEPENQSKENTGNKNPNHFPERRKTNADFNHIDIAAIMSAAGFQNQNLSDNQQFDSANENITTDGNIIKNESIKPNENKDFIENLLKKKDEKYPVPILEEYPDTAIEKSKKRFLIIASAITFAVILSFVFIGRSCKKDTKEIIRVDIGPVTNSIDSLAKSVPANAANSQNSQNGENINTDKFLTVIYAKEGDNLPALSKKYYNNEVFWIYLYDANKELIPDPKKLDPGIRMVIPRPSAFGFDIHSQVAAELAEKKGAAILAGK